MFCDSCGAVIQPSQNHCTQCGKAILGPVHAGTGRVARHGHLLGIFWIAYSALHLIGGTVLLILANTLFAHLGSFLPPDAPPQAASVPLFLRPLLSFIGILLITKAVVGIIAGVGLLQRQSWARILTLIVGVISLLNIPLGTALGVYTLWVLMAPNADEEYRAMVKSAGA